MFVKYELFESKALRMIEVLVQIYSSTVYLTVFGSYKHKQPLGKCTFHNSSYSTFNTFFLICLTGHNDKLATRRAQDLPLFSAMLLEEKNKL